jgi:hypothetical protein
LLINVQLSHTSLTEDFKPCSINFHQSLFALLAFLRILAICILRLGIHTTICCLPTADLLVLIFQILCLPIR